MPSYSSTLHSVLNRTKIQTFPLRISTTPTTLHRISENTNLAGLNEIATYLRLTADIIPMHEPLHSGSHGPHGDIPTVLGSWACT